MGILSWFAQRPRLAHCLMWSVVALGICVGKIWVPLELIPELPHQELAIQVSYTGATPSQVERAVIIPIEKAIRSIDGVRELSSTAVEGHGTVSVVVADGYDPALVLESVRVRVDSVVEFPSRATTPTYQIQPMNTTLISLLLSGNLPERELRMLAEKIRDDILGVSSISRIELVGIRNYEVSIEVSEYSLKKYGLTIDQIADQIGKSSFTAAVGAISSAGRKIFLRTSGESLSVADFESIRLKTLRDGKELTLKDIAKIVDTLDDTPIEMTYGGQPAVFLNIIRMGDEDPLKIVDEVRSYLNGRNEFLPFGISLEIWEDQSQEVRERFSILVTCGIWGTILLILATGALLNPQLAFWIFAGIPFSLLGTVALMPLLGVTLNPISAFAFVVVIGLVVDDSIVTGDSIFSKLQKGSAPLQAAIEGTREILFPVVLAILTTIAGFIPLILVAGEERSYYIQFPKIAISVLILSMIQSKCVLPALLIWARSRDFVVKPTWMTPVHDTLNKFRLEASIWLEQYVLSYFQATLRNVIEFRYRFIGLFLGIVCVASTLVISGRVAFRINPPEEYEIVRGRVRLPEATPFRKTKRYVKEMLDGVERISKELDSEAVSSGVVGKVLAIRGGHSIGPFGQNELGEVAFHVDRDLLRNYGLSSQEVIRAWTVHLASFVESGLVFFQAEAQTTQPPIAVQLTGADSAELLEMATRVSGRLEDYTGLFNIRDVTSDGREELIIRKGPLADSLGVTTKDLTEQIQLAYSGAEVQQLQRGREEVRVIVRYPKKERQSLHNLLVMGIQLPNGQKVPLGELATFETGTGSSSINRYNGKRTIVIHADADQELVDIQSVKNDLVVFLTALQGRYPDVEWELGGLAVSQFNSMRSLWLGIIFLSLILYGLLALALRSFLKPLIVMSVIPTSLAGAVLGHLLMGVDLTMMSVFGMMALSGIVVNDSIVLVDSIDRFKGSVLEFLGHLPPQVYLNEALVDGTVARFRPVILTVLTTSICLCPILFSGKPQILYFLPMAVSIVFGAVFSLLTTLYLAPSVYMALEDAYEFLGKRSEVFPKLKARAVSWADIFTPQLHSTLRIVLIAGLLVGLGTPALNRLIISKNVDEEAVDISNEGEVRNIDKVAVSTDLIRNTEQLDEVVDSGEAVSENLEEFSIEGDETKLTEPPILNEIQEIRLVSSLGRGWYFQIGAFSMLNRAQEIVKECSMHGGNALVEVGRAKEKPIYRVVLGPFESESSMKTSLKALRVEMGVRDGGFVRYVP